LRSNSVAGSPTASKNAARANSARQVAGCRVDQRVPRDEAGQGAVRTLRAAYPGWGPVPSPVCHPCTGLAIAAGAAGTKEMTWQYRRNRCIPATGRRPGRAAGSRGWPGPAALAGVGWAAWPGQSAAPSLHLVAGTVQADLLTPDQVSKLAGVSVVSGPGSNEPPAVISASPAKCAAAAGPATRAVYGHSWTAFLSATDEAADGSGDYTASQAVGVFPDGAKATAAFQVLASGLAQCPSSQVAGWAGRAVKWAYAAYPATAVAVAWTATQNGGDGWACYHQAQVSGTALVQAAVCEGGDGGSVASAIAGRVS